MHIAKLYFVEHFIHKTKEAVHVSAQYILLVLFNAMSLGTVDCLGGQHNKTPTL